MPYVLLRIGKKPAGLKEVVFLEHELNNLQRRSKKSEVFTFINTTTRRTRKIRGILPG